MDLNGSLDGSSKKTALEELSKEDLVKKCKNLIVIAQKAKNLKDSLAEENNRLIEQLNQKETATSEATQEVIENLTQQKLDLVTNLSELKNQKNALNQQLAGAESRISELDTENQSYKRQVVRLTDENEELINHLEQLEKQIDELKKIGLQQQEELLELERNNALLSEANNKANVGDDKEIAALKAELEALKSNRENDLKELEECRQKIALQKQETERHVNSTDDLNVELHKNRALVENLRKDLSTTTAKLSESQIMSSGVASDLQNSNDKLREKLQFFHSKIVKLAGSVKILRQEKDILMSDLKDYMDQVKLWKGQLNVFLQKFSEDHEEFSGQYRTTIECLRVENLQLKEENTRLLQRKEESLEILEEDNRTVQEKLNEAFKNSEELARTVEDLQEERAILNDKLKLFAETEDEVKILRDSLEKEKNETENLSKQIQNLVESLRKSEDTNKDLETFRKIMSDLEIPIPELPQHLKSLERTITDLEQKLASLKNTETQLAAHTSQEISRLVQQNSDLTDALKNLQEKPANTAETQTDPLTDELEQELALLRREKLELLGQMNEMNQELKERGENISQQQVHCKELLKKLQAYESQASKKEEVIKSLTEQLEGLGRKEDDVCDVLEAKNAEILRLQAELHKTSSLEAADADETMSTSTISRTEDVSRLKDLEGPWEERYGKLRNLATKMKGKIRDLNAELVKEKTEAQNKLANSVKTVHTLQVKCDKLEDELEVSKSEAKSYLKKLDSVAQDISKDKQALAVNEEEIAALKREVDDLKKDKLEIENWKRQVGAKVKSLKQELEANTVLKKDYEARITKLQQELDAKEHALKTELEQHKQTRNSLHESNTECKKKSVLNLEMQDYERSVKELSQKLEDKQEAITQLKNQIDANRSTTNALREQNKLLEERLEAEDTELTNTRSELNLHKRKIHELEDLVTQKDDKLHTLTRLVEETRLENEELSRELSKVIAEHQKNTSGLKTEVDRLRRQTLGLEQSLREVRDALRLKEEELKVVEQEYKGYKVRAQSVLRQNQTRDIGAEEKLLEEVASLKAHVGNLTQNSDELKSQIQKLTKENEILTAENEELKRKCVELELKFEDEKLQLDQLRNKHQQVLNEHTETVRGLKLHADTLAQCYRQQISDQEVRHNREIIELQSQLNKPPVPTEQPSLPYPSMAREAGEGSESVESSSPTGLNKPVPLERLLNTNTDGEAILLKRQLVENESKVAHLTDLLADTEQDLAKHVQMNQLLKEEIRRQQRSVERERHAENLEYLKNVVLKFITLNNSDERLRLVPVMNTILKLSPDETSQLNVVAKGESSVKGWSNYLPLGWPSPSK